MTDPTLQELWAIKDNLAKEHAYDLDSLVDYLKEKYHSDIESVQTNASPNVESESESSKKLQISHR